MRAVSEEMLLRHDDRLTLRSILVAVCAVGIGVVTAVMFIDNRVAAQTKASGEVEAAKAEALKARVETLEQRFNRFEERTDKQLNAALDALRVPPTKRPPPLNEDGGQ